MSAYLLDFGDIVYAGRSETFEPSRALAKAKKWFPADKRPDGFVGWEVTDGVEGSRPTQHATKPGALVELRARAADALREASR